MNVNNEPTHIYYDLSVFNNDTSGYKPVNLKFSETRSGSNLVQYPVNEYFFSIIRYEMDNLTTPVFIPQPLIGYNNLLIYTFVLETLNQSNEVVNVYKREVTFLPTNPNISTPDPTQDNTSNEYYFVYDFQRWIFMVNKTLNNLFNDIPANEKTGTAMCPFFQYDPITGLVSLYTSVEYESTDNDCGCNKKINLYWNTPTDTVFKGFDTTEILQADCLRIDDNAINNNVYPPTAPLPISKYYKVNIINYHNKNITLLKVNDLTNIPYITLIQSYPSFPMLNPVQNIVFTSGSLPIYHENTATPVIYSTTGQISAIGRADSITPVLTDFITPLQKGTEYKPKIYYYPNVYRLIDLKGNQPLKNVDLQVYWKSRTDAKLHPFLLSAQCGASCKILFRKKEYDNIN